MKKIVITGIGGFVGEYLAAYFVVQGFSVFGFDRHGATIPNVQAATLNLLDKSAVDSYIKEIQPEYLIHLAAQSSVKKSWDNPEETTKINVEGTKYLLSAITAHSPKCITLIVSSAEIYGTPKEIPLTEKSPINPNSPYGKSRQEQEKLCEEYRQKNNLKIIISRSFPHTGPKQTDQFVCSNFAKQIARIEAEKQEPILSVGNLEARRDFTDVRDIVRAYHLLITNPNANGVYNICSGKSIPIAEILKTLLSYSKKKITIIQDPAKMRPSDIPDLLGSNSKFVQLTGWKPEIPFDQTLKEMLNWWRKETALK